MSFKSSLSNEQIPQSDRPTSGTTLSKTHSEDASKDFWQAIATVISLQNQAPPLVAVPREDSIPLSFAQERLWFLDQLAPNKSSAYNMPFAFRITGSLNVSALEQSLNKILRRHEALRTTFSVVEGKPVQIIHPELTVDLLTEKLGEIPQHKQQAKIMHLIGEKVEQPFDLNQGSLFRVSLLDLGKGEYVLLIVVHHIAVDFWSKGILFQELSTLYEAFSTGKVSVLPDLSIQYADFAVWQRKWLQGEFLEVLLGYWKRQLGNHLSELQIPTDSPRSASQTRKGACQKLVLPEELTKELKALSRQERTTLFVVLLAAFKVLLHRYTEQDDIFLCSPIANRNRKEVKELIGYFVNLLILRTDLSGNPSFRDLLGQVRQVASGAYAHQDLPVQQLVKSLNLLQTPLSRIMFGLQNTGVYGLELSGLAVETLEVDGGAADFDLYLYLLEETDKLTAILRYNADLFSETAIAQMLDRFQTVLENAVTNPEQPISQLLPLSEAEQQQLQQKRLNQISSKPERIYIAPRNPLELQLTQIWAQILGIQSVSVKDNFFELGGGSLLAMNLFAQVEKTFGKTLPLTTLLQAPTIELLAKTLAQEGESVSWSSLVPIQTSGTQPPFFCIHGQQGNVLNFRKLAHYLGSDRPFYGLQSKGLNGKELPYFRIEDMAAHYINEIRTLQPEGPYFLGGNSMGGTVAFEMSQQLRRQGQEVALVVMFDTFGLDCFPRLSFRWQHYWSYLLKLGISKSMFDDLSDVLRRKQQEIGSKLYLKLGRSLPQHLSKELVAEANMQAKRGYRAQVYPGRVTLMRASEPASFKRPYLPTSEDWYNRDPQQGWGGIISGGLEIHDVPGDHYSIFHEPHVQVLAQKLKTCLDEAQKRC
ncbi:MAG: condensation domain-containing protein [Hydrococcus sp. Prado102]|jgi:thioesterase domain-containing protein/acyl carrier protein|nr:condensation domain-containing protein [Hydrococcus sp. Prado102]